MKIKKAKIINTSDQDITDLEITFSGYNEAKNFMNSWLGHFQILAPESLRLKYTDFLEEALGII
mgnify:CR=1 FL=1